MNKPSKRLSLNTQTLRTLKDSQLDAIEGGAIASFVYCTSGCASGVPGCSAKCASERHLTCR